MGTEGTQERGEGENKEGRREYRRDTRERGRGDWRRKGLGIY